MMPKTAGGWPGLAVGLVLIALTGLSGPASAQATNFCANAGGTRSANLFALDGTFGTAPAGTQAPTLTSSTNPTPTVTPLRYAMSTVPGVTGGLDAQGRPIGTTTYALNNRSTVNFPGNYSPEDGEYEITNSSYSRQDGAWHRFIGGRNTGNERDLFMFINAAVAAGVFYEQTLTVTPNTNFEFSISIINLIANNSSIVPNVNLEIDRLGVDDNNNGTVDESGEAQTIVLTGNIPNSNTPIWRDYGGVINSGASNRITVRFRNNAPGGGGNDLAIDNLQFTSCTGLSTGNISGRVYLDQNANNTSDAGEPGYGPNVAVSLIGKDQNLNDFIVATAQTAADGSYSFVNVPAGTYTVAVPQNEPQLNQANPRNPSTTAVINSVTYVTRPSTVVGLGTSLTNQNFGFGPAPISLQKTANANSSTDAIGSVITAAAVGNTFQYTLRVTNNTGTNLSSTSLRLMDALPAGLTYVTGSLQMALVTTGSPTFSSVNDGGSYPFTEPSGRLLGRNVGTSTSSFNNGNLNSGETLIVRFRVTVASGPPPQISNQGRITYTISSVSRNVLSDDPNVAGFADPAVVVVGANLTVSKVADLASVSPGSTLRYTITLVNNGALPTTALTLQDPLPAGLTYVPNSAEAAIGSTPASFTPLNASSYPFATARTMGNNVSSGGFNNNTLAVGETLTVRFRVTVADTATGLGQATSLSNQASTVFNYTGGSPTTVPSDDPAFGGPSDPTITPVQYPDLTIQKTAAATFWQGNNSSYTLTVSNTAGSPASLGTVSVTDVLDASLNYVSAGGSGWSCAYTAATRTVACTRSDALSGGSAYPGITLTVVPTAAGPVPNTAGVANGADNNSANNTSTLSLSVQATYTLSGNVFADANANGLREGGEAGLAGVTVALGGAAARTALTDSSGNYAFTFLIPGSYTLTQTDLPGYISITPNLLGVSLGNADLGNQNFADFLGYRLSGTVFRDDGRGGGTANNALQDGGEPGIGGVTVSAVGATTRTASTDASGGFSLLIPSGFGNFTLSQPQGPATGSNVGGTAVQLAAGYNSAVARQRAVTALPNGSSNSGYNFGVVWASELRPDQSGQATSPGVAAYRHTFRPGTLGSASLTVSGAFTYQIRRAAGCTALAPSDALRPVPLSLVVDSTWPRDPDGRLSACELELLVLVPAGRPGGSVDIAQLSASLTWAGNASVTDQRTATDTTTVAATGALRLSKVVRNVTQNIPAAGAYATNVAGRPGDTLEYCIAFRNSGAAAVSSAVLTDPIPFFTNYAPGTLRLDSAPLTDTADADTGELVGTLYVLVRLGTLTAGQTGQVCYRVTIR
ncbi:MAG: SdrD B-like domain-containing protein [Meiothermus sp.]|nr:SdrD B-like domain-containing protein [Meiothermus sp.]